MLHNGYVDGTPPIMDRLLIEHGGTLNEVGGQFCAASQVAKSGPMMTVSWISHGIA